MYICDKPKELTFFPQVCILYFVVVEIVNDFKLYACVQLIAYLIHTTDN